MNPLYTVRTLYSTKAKQLIEFSTTKKQKHQISFCSTLNHSDTPQECPRQRRETTQRESYGGLSLYW